MKKVLFFILLLGVLTVGFEFRKTDGGETSYWLKLVEDSELEIVHQAGSQTSNFQAGTKFTMGPTDTIPYIHPPGEAIDALKSTNQGQSWTFHFWGTNEWIKMGSGGPGQ